MYITFGMPLYGHIIETLKNANSLFVYIILDNNNIGYGRYIVCNFRVEKMYLYNILYNNY